MTEAAVFHLDGVQVDSETACYERYMGLAPMG
jgi:beta-phosphoglucomutase-like phosphatase (HAD superfamily)